MVTQTSVDFGLSVGRVPVDVTVDIVMPPGGGPVSRQHLGDVDASFPERGRSSGPVSFGAGSSRREPALASFSAGRLQAWAVTRRGVVAATAERTALAPGGTAALEPVLGRCQPWNPDRPWCTPIDVVPVRGLLAMRTMSRGGISGPLAHVSVLAAGVRRSRSMVSGGAGWCSR